MSDKFNVIWMFIATAIIVGANVISGAAPLMVVASVIGILFVVGVANGWAHCQLLGAILACFIAYFSFQAGFYGNAVVNALYVLPISLIGWQHWRTKRVVIEKLTRCNRIRCAIATLAVLCLSLITAFATGSHMPVHDAVSTTLLVVATFLLAVGVKEQWYFWLPYNALEVFMWFMVSSSQPEMLAVLAMRLVFLVNSVIGWMNWRKA